MNCLPKVVVLELLRNEPWDQVSGRPFTSAQTVQDALPADLAFEAYLYNTQGLWQPVFFRYRGRQNKELMCRCVAHEL
jgi:hypothetical protein